MAKNFILPISLLVGTIIGAGIFSLPFVFEKSGFGTGLGYLIFLTAAAAIIHLMYVDIILKTDGDHHHRFPGYAKIYLGKYGGLLANIITFSALFLTLTVYLILSVSFLNLIISGGPIYKILLFWVLGSFAIFLGIKKAALFESITATATLLLIFIVFIFGLLANPDKIFSLPAFNLQSLFFPFGPILFSLLGEAAIPALIVYSRKENLDSKNIKRIVIWGTIAPAIFYLMFIVGIIGLSNNVSEDAVSGLISGVSPVILMIIGVFGFISLWDSYAAIGTEIKKILEYEWKLPNFIIVLAVIFIPLILYFSGLQSFLGLVSLVGGILYGLWSIMIIKTWKKVALIESPYSVLKRIRPITANILIFVFLIGIIYHIIMFL